ncbi:MAG: carboxypeptidase-like regulatory domain-containing protein [Bacteroidota bacterium]
MSKARTYIWLNLLIILFAQNIYGQETILNRYITLKPTHTTFLNHVDNLYELEGIVIAFNSSRVDLNEVITLPNEDLPLLEIVNLLFAKHNVSLLIGENKVSVRFLDAPVAKNITINGYIRDGETGEALVGASIYEMTSQSSTFSNESGFYSLTIPAESNEVRVNYLGYRTLKRSDITVPSLNLNLEFDNLMDQVVIEGAISNNFLLGSGSEKIDLALTAGFQSTSGDNDVIRAVRTSPKVQSGNEGQVGLYVRGGGPDQNLILFDGIPLYEVSHAAGFSSIFIEESIKDIDFISNGFPARYGGRLSSVMNVRLKEGNQNGYNGSVKFSLPGMKAHIEGPLFSPKTTINVAGRISYIDRYLNQLIGDFVSFERVDLNYEDLVAKITHRFSPTQKLSFSFYTGEDNIGLLRNNEISDGEDFFQTISDNGVRWGSTVWNGKFTNVVSDKLQLTFNVGGIQYRNNSQANFRINSAVNFIPDPTDELEVLTNSEIQDIMTSFNLDYYFNDKHRFKFGASWIHHEYNPALYGSDTIFAGDLTQIVPRDNQTIADELALYFEDTYTPHEKWQIYGGLHISAFNTGNQRFSNAQPRFSTVYSPNESNRFTFSFSNMYQYIHLLVNPGIGLPSDFWVPSTNELPPEFARQFSIDYYRKLGKSMELSISAYTKSIKNVLEYESTVDIFLDFVNATELPRIVTNPNWEEFVLSGDSQSRGIEFQIRKTSGRLTGWASYALAKTTRIFEGINNGEEFPYKYDRRHDVNLGVQYVLNKNISFSLNWVYGTGTAFSLGSERVRSIRRDENGDPIFIISNTGDRNNLRFPDFSHLDFQFNYNREFNGGKLTFNFGLYNVYNRKNAYYIYVYNDSGRGENVVYKTSLFPILPNMSLGYSF